MKPTNNWIDRVGAGYLLSPNEAFSTGIGLYLIGLFTKVCVWRGFPGNSQIT